MNKTKIKNKRINNKRTKNKKTKINKMPIIMKIRKKITNRTKINEYALLIINHGLIGCFYLQIYSLFLQIFCFYELKSHDLLNWSNFLSNEKVGISHSPNFLLKNSCLALDWNSLAFQVPCDCSLSCESDQLFLSMPFYANFSLIEEFYKVIVLLFQRNSTDFQIYLLKVTAADAFIHTISLKRWSLLELS